MKKIMFLSILLGIGLQCYAQKKNNYKWHLHSLEGWVNENQDDNPLNQCEIRDGILKIFTRAHSWDRKKVKTQDKKYTSGKYTWRTYIPQMGKHDQASVGSWIYADDQHELDFEVGYGNEQIRKELHAAEDDMIVYMTSQDFPSTSVPMKIKPGWHIFEIDLKLKNNKYHVTWLINKKKKHSVQLEYGTEVPFHIYCSVENLKFLGEHMPKQDNYGLFDYVKYRYR